jgi:hypothetical protein
MMEVTGVGIFMNHTCRAMAASSHAEIKNICVCSWRKLTVNFIHHITNSPINNFKHLTSSNWLSYLQLQHIFFLGLRRIQTARNTIFIRVAAL